MKKLPVILLSVLAILTSCKDEGNIGLALQNPDDLVGTTLLDTLSMTAGTILYQENAFSDSTNVLLVGSYTDSYVGKVTAKTFFELRQTETDELGTNPICDSVKLELFIALNSSSEARVYGDTTKPASYHLYELAESIAEKKYLNSEMVAVESTALSSLENKTFNPIQNAFITFPIDKSFGTQIFTYWNKPEVLLSNIKGLSIQSSGEDAALFGINVNNNLTRLRIYYHNDQESGLVKNLAISADAKRFNQVIADRSGTPLNVLTNDGDIVMDDNTNGNLYLQSGTGLGTVFKFAALPQVLDSLKGAVINKAEIKFHMLPNSYTGAVTRPTKINSLVKTTSSLQPMKENGKLAGILIDRKFTTEVNPDYVNQTYTLALTSYFQDLVLGDEEVSGFFLQPLENGTSVARSVLCGPNCTDISKRPQLKIYYTK